MKKVRKRHHHISPVPDGFLVRVAYGGVIIQRFVRKNEPHALRVAMKLRDELLAETPMKYDGAYPACLTVARSNTGFVGMTYTVSKEGYEFIKATAPVARCQIKGRSFSLRTYGGYDAALKAALDWRESILEKRHLQSRNRPKPRGS